MSRIAYYLVEEQTQEVTNYCCK